MPEQVTIIVTAKEIQRRLRDIRATINSIYHHIDKENLDRAYSTAEKLHDLAFDLKDYLRSGDA